MSEQIRHICNDCTHVVRCCSMAGAHPSNTECLFVPDAWTPHPRFVKPDEAGEAAAGRKGKE